MMAKIFPWLAIILTNAYIVRSQYTAVLSTASEVFLIFTTYLFSCLCSYNATMFIS